MNKKEMFEQILAMTYDIGQYRLNNPDKNDKITYQELREVYNETKKQYLEMLEERK